MSNPKFDRLHVLANDRARAPWGLGWDKLTPDHREALVAREVMFILLGQAESSKQFDAAKTLVRRAMGYEVKS